MCIGPGEIVMGNAKKSKSNNNRAVSEVLATHSPEIAVPLALWFGIV